MSKSKKSFNKHTLRTKPGNPVSWALPAGMTAGAAVIILATFLVYIPSLNGGFVLDDRLLTENEIVKASDGLYRFWCSGEAPDYWPVTNSTFWIEWRLWGTHSTGYHLVNLTLHMVESLLIWIILRKMAMPGAFLGALIFAVHPVNVESVAWIAQRKNMTAMFFFLLSVLCYLKFFMRAPRPTDHAAHGARRCPLAAKQTLPTAHCPPSTSLSFNSWYWLSLAAFVLAMLGKGSTVVLPVLLLLIVWWLHERISIWDLVKTGPFFLVAGTLTVVNLWFQTHGAESEVRSAGIVERLLGACGVAWFYLSKAVFPIELVFVYPQWHIETGRLLWWLPLAAALAVTAVFLLYRKSWSRPFLFAWAFFGVALVPVMGFTDVGFMKYSLVADHYQHIAIIAVIVLASAGLGAWHGQTSGQVTAIGGRRRLTKWSARVVAAALVGVLMFLTWQQSGLYRDAITLYQATLEKNPGCSMAHYNLGHALMKLERRHDAIEHFRETLRLDPDSFDAHNNLGVALAQIGKPGEAVDQYEQALRIKPKYAEAHNNLGVSLVKLGRFQEALERYRQALALKPDYPEAYNNLGNAYKTLGQYSEAISHFERALTLKPDYYEAQNNLGNAFKLMGQYQQAIEHYEKALRLNPDFPEAHINLGMALVQTNRPLEAMEHYKQALALSPESAEAHSNLGQVLLDTGRVQEAIEHFRQALRINPNYIEAHNNLGVALVQTGQPEEAIGHYQQVLRLKPDFTTVQFNLALAYASASQSAEAVAAAQKALELARCQGKTAEAKQIEDWLDAFANSNSKVREQAH